jgi:hypothetical protein
VNEVFFRARPHRVFCTSHTLAIVMIFSKHPCNSEILSS